MPTPPEVLARFNARLRSGLMLLGSRSESPEVRRAAQLVRRRDRTALLNSWGPRYLTGNALAAACRHSLNYGPLSTNPTGHDCWWFARIDRVEQFFDHHAPDSPFVLVTHNGDTSVDPSLAGYLEHPSLVVWFATNVALKHPKLVPVPIGIANPIWPHGESAKFDRVIAGSPSKTNLLEVSFSVETNRSERARCLDETGLRLMQRAPFGDYLRRLASSYFCVSPAGNGLDCHRTWEALYVGTVPIVTSSALTDELADLPWIVLEDWSQFRSLGLSPDLHTRLMADWDSRRLMATSYVRRMQATVAAHSE